MKAVRTREAIRRKLGKPERRSGTDRRKGKETAFALGTRFHYAGKNDKASDQTARIELFGQNKRS